MHSLTWQIVSQNNNEEDENMKYVLKDFITGATDEITFEEAKRIVSKYYEEYVCTYEEMLELEQTIPCGHRQIIVTEA